MSHLLKLSNAEAHLEKLERSVKQWDDSKPFEFPGKFDTQSREMVFRLKIKNPYPDEWVQLAGDILFNLRATLDYLAFELALMNKGSLTDKQVRDCCFPIFGERGPNKDETSRIFDLFSPGARKVIERIQPYRNGDYRRNVLWQIHVLNNIDKHRSLHVVAANAEEFTVVPVENIVVRDVKYVRGFVNDGDEIARFRIDPQDIQKGAKLFTELTALVCYKDTPGGTVMPVAQGLRFGLDYIKNDICTSLGKYL